ncbi:Serine/threonine protein phosphatase 2A 57 kDa regulatory subunit B' kappa isoform [Camellia lanceoleosa]|uniref:Serine/threonine protein phosphatase 2A 57 kDa regulatory subunit B' kappa isoform n=1 Tax=Camellia lanceoleosa TaxID=1840588 RepID=A0ACC0IVG4_9ERIC|nr:Serine/threonine protein phosphatase 2A 57 kDa regulatory subunit B' kappa isoform [Camellia lanceoleosa]
MRGLSNSSSSHGGGLQHTISGTRSNVAKRTSSALFPSSVVTRIEPLLAVRDVPSSKRLNLFINATSLLRCPLRAIALPRQTEVSPVGPPHPSALCNASDGTPPRRLRRRCSHIGKPPPPAANLNSVRVFTQISSYLPDFHRNMAFIVETEPDLLESCMFLFDYSTMFVFHVWGFHQHSRLPPRFPYISFNY